MLSAARELIRRELPEVVHLSEELPGFEIQLVGHSLGGGVAALMTSILNSDPALRAALRHAPRIHCVAVAPPAVACASLADDMRPYVISVIREHDVVPHCSMAQVARLQQEVLQTDWYSDLKGSVLGMAYIRGVSSAVASATDLLPSVASSSSGVAQVQRLAAELLTGRHLKSISAALGLAGGALGDGGAAGAAGRPLPLSGNDGRAQDQQQQQQQHEKASQTAAPQPPAPATAPKDAGSAAVAAAACAAGAAPDAWQLAVVQRWASHLAQQVVPYLQGAASSVTESDLRQAADSSVASLSEALSGWAEALPRLPQLPPSLKQLPLPGLPFGPWYGDVADSARSDGRGQVGAGAADQRAAGKQQPGKQQLEKQQPEKQQPEKQRQRQGQQIGDTTQCTEAESELMTLARWRDELDWWGWDMSAGVSAAKPPPGRADWEVTAEPAEKSGGSGIIGASSGASSGGSNGGSSGGSSRGGDVASGGGVEPPVSLYPPGRILFLRSAAGPGSPADEVPGAPPGTPQAPCVAGEPSADGPGPAAAQTHPRHHRHRHQHLAVELVELDPSELRGPGFDRIILHDKMLSDHRTRAYRSALLRVLKSLPVEEPA